MIDILYTEGAFPGHVRGYVSDGLISRFLAASPVPITLRMVGVLRCDASLASMVWQGLARATIAVALAAFFLAFVASPLNTAVPGCGAGAAECRRRGVFVSEVALPIGAALALLPFCSGRHQRRLKETFWLVRGVAMARGYDSWEARGAWAEVVEVLELVDWGGQRGGLRQRLGGGQSASRGRRRAGGMAAGRRAVARAAGRAGGPAAPADRRRLCGAGRPAAPVDLRRAIGSRRRGGGRAGARPAPWRAPLRRPPDRLGVAHAR